MRPAAAVCLGSGFSGAPSPVTGTVPLDSFCRGGPAPVPFWLVHGTRDAVVGVAHSRAFAAALADRGWPVRLYEPATDHAGVVMAEHDPGLRRARPAARGHAVLAGQLSAAVMAAACGVAPAPAGQAVAP